MVSLLVNSMTLPILFLFYHSPLSMFFHKKLDKNWGKKSDKNSDKKTIGQKIIPIIFSFYYSPLSIFPPQKKTKTKKQKQKQKQNKKMQNKINPQSYTLSHTPTVAQRGGGWCWLMKPLSRHFDMLQYFEKFTFSGKPLIFST